ncbi:histidine protein methyltransferase 1 homolog [Sergentomyia squamirostris]
MFQFNFKIQEDDKEVKTGEEKGGNDEKNVPDDEIVASEEVTLPEDLSVDELNGQSSLFISRDTEIFVRDSVDEFSNEGNESSHTDLIPGEYEGGFKIWECTQDLADYMLDKLAEVIHGKRVLDLGCGAGVLGIIALKLGAERCCFQDYNKSVLQKYTIPNVLLNSEIDDKVSIDKCQFYSGDWKSFTTDVDTEFDLILTSETIYNPANNQKLIDLFVRKLKKNGSVILAAKTYYFGVGGGLRQFEELLSGRMQNSVVWKNSDGVTREIIKIEHV